MQKIKCQTGRPITYTSEGAIPAISVNAEGRSYYFVVKIKLLDRKNKRESALVVPVRNDEGSLVYAVPGGGSYVP